MGGTAVHHVHQLVYCHSSKRWHAYKDEAYCCPIHCGDSICIRVKDRYFLARVERDTQWYLLINNINSGFIPNRNMTPSYYFSSYHKPCSSGACFVMAKSNSRRQCRWRNQNIPVIFGSYITDKDRD